MVKITKINCVDLKLTMSECLNGYKFTSIYSGIVLLHRGNLLYQRRGCIH